MMVGVMEDTGRLPARMKLAGLGGKPKKLIKLGDEKSSISLFMMTPVCSEMNPAPKLRKIQTNFSTVSLQCFYSSIGY